MQPNDWIDEDMAMAHRAVDRAIRTCPACGLLWEKKSSSKRFWRTQIRCPGCGVESVRDRRCRALWFANPLRRIVSTRGDDDE
jgi:predicted RNA-binding Zn-ribbon protein involved in translation (DUF1610 family)